MTHAFGTPAACANCWCFVCEVQWQQCSQWGEHHKACYSDRKWLRVREEARLERQQAPLAQAKDTAPEGRAGSGQEEEVVVLDAGQQRAVDLCLAKKNVFLTGMGGTGKF